MPLFDPANPAAWLLGSFAAIVLASNLAWLIVRRKASDPAFRMGPLAAGGWLALGLFYLLLPFLAIRSGVVSPYALGLNEIEWPATFSTGLVLASASVVGLLFGWVLYRRTRPDGPQAPPLARLVSGLQGPANAALQQWHWTFYRATAAVALAALPAADLPLGLGRALDKAQGDPFYWGAWLGIALAGIEWALNPFSRSAAQVEGERAAALRRAALAVATTGLFVLTRNFWLCLTAHLVVETLAATWFALPLEPAPQPD